MPGCNIDNCKGNRVLTRDEYVEYTREVPEPREDFETYYIHAGHYKNYTADRATHKGATTHTPVVTGKHINFMLGQLATWAGDLLYGMRNEEMTAASPPAAAAGDEGDTEDEDYDPVETGTALRARYMLVDYARESEPFEPSHQRFIQYVRRCTSPLSQPAREREIFLTSRDT